MSIPLFAFRPAIEGLLGAVAERQRAVLESGHYILGPEVEAFEAELAAYLGVDHCVGVGNGTDALTIALRALGVRPGDEVVVPALTFYATAEAVVDAGGVPVFCDVDPETLTMTAETAEAVITERTAAILPVHLFGNPAPMQELCELAETRGLRVLEDAAQAAGAKLGGKMAGALGDAAAFSFFPSKNLGGFGDGGAIATDDDAVAALARRLRAHGSSDKEVHTEVGYNSRLDELQAASLRVLLPHLDEWTAARRGVAAAYAAGGLAEHVELLLDSGRRIGPPPVCGAQPPAGPARGEPGKGGGRRPRVLHDPSSPPAGDGALRAPASFPVVDRAAAESLALPMGPSLSDDQVAEVVDAVARCSASA